MSLFPPGTTFQRNVKTDGFSCVEMQTNRPWTYQVSLYHRQMHLEFRRDFTYLLRSINVFLNPLCGF